MRGMYMKVLVVLSERVAMTAELTVKTANTYYSQFWNGLDAAECMAVLKDVQREADLGHAGTCACSIQENEETIRKAQGELGALSSLLFSGRLSMLEDGLGRFENYWSRIAKCQKEIERFSIQLAAATSAEDSVRELVAHMSEYLKRNDATGAPTALGSDFEKLLETAKKAVDAARVQRGFVSHDEDYFF